LSSDADFSKSGLTLAFAETVDELESRRNWTTNWLNHEQAILGSLDGIKASVWQLQRQEPLETITVEHRGMKLVLTSEAETIRTKSMAVISGGATRDYLDLAALFENAGPDKTICALKDINRYYASG
jgi:hypothetical protein